MLTPIRMAPITTGMTSNFGGITGQRHDGLLGIDLADGGGQERVGKAAAARHQITVVVSEASPRGPKYGCWKVAATKLPIRSLGSRARCWALAFCSFTAVT